MLYTNLNFNEFNITEEDFNELSGNTKYKYLQNFFYKMIAFRKVKSRTVGAKKKKIYCEQ